MSIFVRTDESVRTFLRCLLLQKTFIRDFTFRIRFKLIVGIRHVVVIVTVGNGG